MVTQARSGPDATSVFPDSRKVLYCYVVPGSIVVVRNRHRPSRSRSQKAASGVAAWSLAIENVVGLVGEGFTRVVAEGIKFQIGLAGDDSVPAAFYEAFADRGPSGCGNHS